MTENDAISALTRGDAKAFEFLFISYYERLVAFIITYTNDKMMSEDIVQQVFVNLWNNREKLYDVKSPRSYLYAMTYNYFVDEVKRKHKMNKLLEKIYEDALRDRIVESEEILEKRINKIKAVIETLPSKCAEIFKMNKVQGYRYKEIAEILGISLKTVENQMGIALKKIRRACQNDQLFLMIISKRVFYCF